MTADTLTRRRLNRATLARQLLLARAEVSAVEAVEASAQDYRALRMVLQPAMTQAMRVLADEHRGLVVTSNLRVRSTFLVDGFVRGTWEVRRTRSAATLRLAPFQALPRRAAGELAEEGEALLRFAEEDADSFDIEVTEPRDPLAGRQARWSAAQAASRPR